MKLNKKLLASAMGLGLAALTTVGSTFAWFTANGSTKVEGIEMNATTADKGIFVSLDGKTYYEKLDLADVFKPAINEDGKYSPCTTADGINFYTIKGFKQGADTETYKVGDETVNYDLFDYITATNGTNVGETFYYVSFDLYFAISTGNGLAMNVEFTGASADPSILDVARFSYQATGLQTAANATICGLKSTTATRDADTALNAYCNLFGCKIKNKFKGLTGGTSDNVFTPTAYKNSTQLLASNTLATNVLATSGTSIPGYNYAKVHFNFWIEGNDAFCYNAIASQKYTGSLTFTATN